MLRVVLPRCMFLLCLLSGRCCKFDQLAGVPRACVILLSLGRDGTHLFIVVDPFRPLLLLLRLSATNNDNNNDDNSNSHSHHHTHNHVYEHFAILTICSSFKCSVCLFIMLRQYSWGDCTVQTCSCRWVEIPVRRSY